jgi:nicotinate-nucleotide pyrophosphorylase (carboxylating)
MNLPDLIIVDAVRCALLEDLGHGHDITSETLIPENTEGRAVMHAREPGIVAGISCAATAFRLICPEIETDLHLQDGARLRENDNILTVCGPAGAILTAERTALNFVTMMSGIASETARYVEAVKGTNAKIVCTRKTLPGVRPFQKYAVRMGGGHNHRHGLDDGILIKDNHIALAGGIQAALDKACASSGHMVKIEIEVDTLEQLDEVLEHGGAGSVLLDNMNLEQMRKAVEKVKGCLIIEASGNVSLENVRKVAETGVDMISIGALTHSIKALDIGLDGLAP